MYSFACATMAEYSAALVFEVACAAMPPECSSRIDFGSGASSLSTIAVSRSVARASAAFAGTPRSGRTGVTMVIWSFTESNTTTMVGRIRSASGVPKRSGLTFGRRSICRTMS